MRGLIMKYVNYKLLLMSCLCAVYSNSMASSDESSDDGVGSRQKNTPKPALYSTPTPSSSSDDECYRRPKPLNRKEQKDLNRLTRDLFVPPQVEPWMCDLPWAPVRSDSEDDITPPHVEYVRSEYKNSFNRSLDLDLFFSSGNHYEEDQIHKRVDHCAVHLYHDVFAPVSSDSDEDFYKNPIVISSSDDESAPRPKA